MIRYIPIDGMKCYVKNLTFTDIKNNSNLEWYENRNKLTNEVKWINTAHHGMEIYYYPKSGRIVLKGSLHKFINNGEHNANMFTETLFYESLIKLHEIFSIMPKNLYITNLEFGVNITPIIDANRIIDNLFFYKSTEFCRRTFNNSNYKEAKLNDKYIKVYNKGKQYNLTEDILRIEIKQMRWGYYRSKGITTIEDFIGVDKQIFVDNLLNTIYQFILFDDTIDCDESTRLKYTSLNHWKTIKNRTSKTRLKQHMNDLSMLQGCYLLHETILEVALQIEYCNE